MWMLPPTNEALMHNYYNTHASLHRGIFINTKTVEFALESYTQIGFAAAVCGLGLDFFLTPVTFNALCKTIGNNLKY